MRSTSASAGAMQFNDLKMIARTHPLLPWCPLHEADSATALAAVAPRRSGRQGGREAGRQGWQAGRLASFGTAPIGGLRLLAFHVARDPRQTTGGRAAPERGGVGGVTRGWHAGPQLLTKSLDLCDCVPPGPVPSVIHSRPAGFCRSCAWRGIHSTFVQARGGPQIAGNRELCNTYRLQTPDSRLQTPDSRGCLRSCPARTEYCKCTGLIESAAVGFVWLHGIACSGGQPFG